MPERAVQKDRFASQFEGLRRRLGRLAGPPQAQAYLRPRNRRHLICLYCQHVIS